MAEPGQRLRRTTDGTIICGRLVLGRSFGQRFKGLMGRAGMEEDEGLYLPSSSIHMMFMRFAIDALFVTRADDDGKRRVVAVRERLPAWRGLVLPVRHAEGVVEMPAGTLARHGVRVDDMVTFEEDDSGASDASLLSPG